MLTTLCLVNNKALVDQLIIEIDSSKIKSLLIFLNIHVLTMQIFEWGLKGHGCKFPFQSIFLGWLPGYTDVTQIVLVILTLAGLFLDRPHILGFCIVLNF